MNAPPSGRGRNRASHREGPALCATIAAPDSSTAEGGVGVEGSNLHLHPPDRTNPGEPGEPGEPGDPGAPGQPSAPRRRAFFTRVPFSRRPAFHPFSNPRLSCQSPEPHSFNRRHHQPAPYRVAIVPARAPRRRRQRRQLSAHDTWSLQPNWHLSSAQLAHETGTRTSQRITSPTATPTQQTTSV